MPLRNERRRRRLSQSVPIVIMVACCSLLAETMLIGDELYEGGGRNKSMCVGRTTKLAMAISMRGRRRQLQGLFDSGCLSFKGAKRMKS